MADHDDSPPTSPLRRTARLGGLAAAQGARWAGTRAANLGRSPAVAEAASARQATRSAVELTARLGEMKGLAMKLGQLLSVVDLTPVPAAERDRVKAVFAALRDDAPTVPFAAQRRVIEAELGGPVERVFAAFDEHPVAAASIGQVYRARTHAGGEVAVKVQYAGIAEAVEADLRTLRVLAPAVRRVAPGLDVRAILDELRDRIGEELDYELEAQHQRTVGRAFRRHPFVRVPAVDTALSTRRVLVSEFVEAHPFAAVQRMDEPTRDRFAELSLRACFGLLTREQLIFGDPHPGNLLLGQDGRLVLLDFGLLRRIAPADLDGERAVARAAMARDAAGVKAAMDELGYLPDPGAVSAEGLLAQLLAGADWYFTPGRRRLDPDAARVALEQGLSPRSAHFGQMRRLTIPAPSLLLRRMEALLLAGFGELRAAADWHALVSEYVLGAAPSTPLGEQECSWRTGDVG